MSTRLQDYTRFLSTNTKMMICNCWMKHCKIMNALHLENVGWMALLMPLIIHARNAVEDVIIAIKSAKKSVAGVVHSYNGSLQQAQQLIDLGFLLSFGGAITYDRATRLRKIIEALPMDAIMVETDAPDQPTQANNGNRNEPSYLCEVVASIATIKKLEHEEVIQKSNANAIRLFNLPNTA